LGAKQELIYFTKEFVSKGTSHINMNVFDLNKAMEAPEEELEESSNTVFICPVAKSV
jgi:hypothetical protein